MSNELEKEERISDTKRIHPTDELAIESAPLTIEPTDEELIAEYEEKIKELDGKIKEIKKAKTDKINEDIKRLLSKTNEFGRQTYTQAEVVKLSNASASAVKKAVKELKVEKEAEAKD